MATARITGFVKSVENREGTLDNGTRWAHVLVQVLVNGERTPVKFPEGTDVKSEYGIEVGSEVDLYVSAFKPSFKFDELVTPVGARVRAAS